MPIKISSNNIAFFYLIFIIISIAAQDAAATERGAPPQGAAATMHGAAQSEPAEVGLVVLSDKECVECDVSQLLSGIKQRFRNVRIKEVDINSKKGRKMSAELEIKRLPALVFDKRISYTKDFEMLVKSNLISEINNGRNYMVSSGISHGVFLDRRIEPDTMHFFVMSYCPFGISAEIALSKLKPAEKESVGKLVIHYIVQYDGAGNFNSLHGQKEVDEDMRQLLIGRYYPDRLGDYLLKMGKDIENTDWKAVAKELNFDTGFIESKMADEAKELLKAEAALTEELGINTSPTYLFENRYKVTNTENLKKMDRFKDMELPKGGCAGIPHPPPQGDAAAK